MKTGTPGIAAPAATETPGPAGIGRDPTLRSLAEKPDDRLLRDVGLTREAVLGPAGTFWREWLAIREPWRL